MKSQLSGDFISYFRVLLTRTDHSYSALSQPIARFNTRHPGLDPGSRIWIPASAGMTSKTAVAVVIPTPWLQVAKRTLFSWQPL
jgi:hypothetical protein